MTKELAQKTLKHLEGYLAGRESGAIVSDWAVQVFTADGEIESPLLEETIIALMNLGHEDERFDTPPEDLEIYRECLLGKRPFEPAQRIVRENVN